MVVVRTIDEVRDHVSKARSKGYRVGFVPTMGYLHDGHLSLVEISRRDAQFAVMSIFVNKMQFNDPKDYATYPRELQRDLDLAQRAGVDVVFTPDDAEMYKNPLTYVDMNILTDHLCGAHRPGHFRGVFTVVSKLFNIVQPDLAVFGQKDIQQVIGIEKMVANLNFPIRIIVAPIIREATGLARSSRNKHLNDDQRSRAVGIHRSLQKAESLIAEGTHDAGKLIEAVTSVLSAADPDSIDYISLVDYATLQPADALGEKNVIAVAAFFGQTRLIDNMIIEKTEEGYRCVY